MDERKGHKLAKIGFSHTTLKHYVKCYFCSLEIRARSVPTDVEAEHLRLSTNCFFANGKENLPSHRLELVQRAY